MKQHTPDDIIKILREADTSPESVGDFCQLRGIAEATLYRWQQKYGRLQVDEAKRLKALEIENAKLKKMLAEAMLANEGLKDLLAKNDAPSSTARGAAAFEGKGLSQCNSCRWSGWSRGAAHYALRQAPRDAAATGAMQQVMAQLSFKHAWRLWKQQGFALQPMRVRRRASTAR